jgi:tRNA nucleotidyltransferase (CCA-adding enzyme)
LKAAASVDAGAIARDCGDDVGRIRECVHAARVAAVEHFLGA